jgi:chaperone modulatory protein CbpM
VDTAEFVLQARIAITELDEWVAAGWLLPDQVDAARRYSEADLARAHLIGDLRDLGANDEAIPIILDLVDQIYGLRRALRGLLLTIKMQQQEQGGHDPDESVVRS